MVEAEVVDFIDDFDNDKDEGKIESPRSKNWRGGIVRA